MKIHGAQLERFLSRRDPAVVATLVYGPDEGLVRERIERLMARDLGETADPFARTDLMADTLRTDPRRLVDEARSPTLMGGHRVIRVRRAGDQATSACKALLELAKIEATVIIEGGDLGPSSSLRKLFDDKKQTNAAALPCYHDEAGDLAGLIDAFAKEHQLDLDPDARGYLMDQLGSDRGVTRAELERLALYVLEPSGAEKQRQPPLTLEQVSAVIGDSAALGIDDLVDAVALGDLLQTGRYLDRLLAEGQHPVRIVRSLLNHFMRLRRFTLQRAAGEPFEQIMRQTRPPVHFRRKGKVQAALRRWSEPRISTALTLLTEAEIACKTTGWPAALMCRDAAFRLAQAGEQRS